MLPEHGGFEHRDEPPICRNQNPSARQTPYNCIKAAEQKRDDQKCKEVLKPKA
jgi:hypothetical protein